MKQKMKYFLNWAVAILLVIGLTPATTIHTSYASDDHGGGSDEVVAEMSNNATNSSVKLLNSGRAECARLPKAYRLDCLRQTFSRAARPLESPDYRGAKKELNSASRQIKRLVNSNVDKSAPILKVKNRKYKAVKKAVVASLNKQATKIITESATKLLRSGSKSKQRRSHYTKIAKAFDSTKVILRS